jgi:hypothetical protein
LVGALVALLAIGRLAAEQGPAWLALGVPYRYADPGTVVNGDTEKKLPLYDRLVPEVYQFADRHKVQEGVLRFVPHPRWFTGVGPVKGSGDLPRVDQGTSLSFGITPSENGQLKFDLGIEGKEREVFFQVEHRRNDITPFLFAFTADGRTVDAKLPSGGVNGGVTLMNVLMGKGERKDFSFTVDPKDVLTLIGERKVTELSVVAAFCERRQEFTTGGIRMIVGKDSGISFVEGEDEAADFRKGEVPPIIREDGEEMAFGYRPILIRSKPVRLVFAEGKWSVKGE